VEILFEATRPLNKNQQQIRHQDIHMADAEIFIFPLDQQMKSLLKLRTGNMNKATWASVAGGPKRLITKNFS
jgi:hypothetical protein